MLNKSMPTLAQGRSGTSWGISVSRCWLVSWLRHIEHADMYSLRSAFMLGQNKHPLARRKHPSIPRCDEWTRSLSVCRRSVGMTTRSPRKTRPSCTESSSRYGKYGATWCGRSFFSVGHPSMITARSCWRCSSEDVYSLICCNRCSVIGKYCTMLMCPRPSRG